LSLITAVKLKNFKSFKKAEIPIAMGFTAIAGANASGKSNILDSILFAMGITSLKMLRASRLTELVNQDAKEGYAKVELLIKDNNNKDVNITRIIDRQGKSIYKLDDKRKTLNEIQSYLQELGMSPSGHNIVVQGDITKVIEMNAKQRRQMIEEAAGLQEFEEKKEEAMKKLEKVEQRVKDTNLVLRERENYLAQLEKEREIALRYNQLKEELKKSKATILVEEIKIIKKELAGAKKTLEAMEKEIVESRKERDLLQEEEKELERKVEEITKQLINASEKTYSTLGKEVEQKRGHMNLIKERLESKTALLEEKLRRVENVKDEIKDMKKSKGEKEEQLKAARDSLEKIDSALKQIKEAISAKNPGLEKRKLGIANDEQRLSELRKDLEELREKIHTVNSRKNSAEKDRKLASQIIAEAEPRKQRLEERAREKKDIEKKILELEKKGLNEKLKRIEDAIEKANSEIHSAKGRIENILESVQLLSRTKAECPTCDNPIDEKHKNNVTKKKEGEVASLKEKIRALEEDRKKLVAQKEMLIAEEREFSQLTYSLKSFQGIEEELRKISERISESRQVLATQKTDLLEKEEISLRAKIGSLEKEKSMFEEKLRQFRESDMNTHMNELIEKMHELNEQKSEKETFVARVSTELGEALEKKIIEREKELSNAEESNGEIKKGIKELDEEKKKAEKDLGEMETELEKANKANKLLEEEKERVTTKIGNISGKREGLAVKIENREKEMNEFNIQQSRNEVRIVDLEEEFKYYENVKPLEEFKLNDLKSRIPEVEKEIDKMGAVNMKALGDFEHFKKEVDEVRGKADKLDQERKAVLEMIDKIDVRKLNIFMDCFNFVSKRFGELYYNFFEGEGKLDLSDKESPLEGGLLIHAKYKEDTIKSIDAMSGGEKSLTALAFLFAIQSFEPAPFYILDEVDAALDKENSIKVGRLIKEQSKNSQFISISHNEAVINQADQIIGVALNKQKSSIISLKLGGHKGDFERGS